MMVIECLMVKCILAALGIGKWLSHSSYLVESVVLHVYLGLRTLLALQIPAVVSIGMDLLTSLSNRSDTRALCNVRQNARQ